jgi:glutamate-1-semialdehyde aminotransferase/malonyl CoA-acyl carrier protein transacylase/acyl carrier protein
MLGLEKDYIGTRVSYKLNLKGPALSIHTGCSTSLVAIIEAVKNLRLGNCDIALAGGISISGRPNAGHLYQEGGILSKDGNCTPFDKNSSGTIFTDGGGVIVLKRLDRAILDNDKIEAVISGVGVNNDGADKMSFTAPSVNGQSKVIIEAIKDAKISAEQIKMIETHGTATPVGDPIEVEALNLAFKKLKTNKQPHIVLTSLKSNVGHLTAAAGVGSVIKVILSLKNKIIPGVAGFKELNPLINNVDNFFSISSSATKFNVLENETCYAGVSSFGVGGTNAHLIMREHLPPKEELGKQDVHNTTSTHLFKLSAKNEDQLVAMKNELIQKLKCSNASDYEKISFTLDSGKDEYNFRSCLVLNVDDLESEKYFFSNQVIKKHKLAFIFPGQGSHYAKMGKTLYSKNIIFKDSFDSIVKYVNNELGEDITKIMWSENSEELLKDTYYSQPAIFCLEYALGKTLIHLGIRPDFFIGHSIGEFACAALGEVFSEVDAAKIVVKRAKLMKKCSGGKMLSVAADELTAKDFATRFNLDIAAINGNKSIVISGCLDSINQLKEYLDSIQVGSIELKTSHAFHSKMMIDVAKEYYDFLKNFKFNKSSIKIISTVDGQVVDIESPEYWADHIVKTVNFKSVIAQIVKSQDVAFLEVGSRSILSSFIKKDYPNKFITIETLGNNENDELEKLKFAIGKLWVYGISNTIPDIMFAKQDKKRVETILYPFVKNHVWLKSKKINKQQVNKVNKIKTVGVTMSNEKLKLLQNKLCEVFEKSSGINVQEYGVNTTFLEMGMDSLFLTQVSLQLKKDLEVTVGFRQLLENFDTIDSLANHLIDKVNPKYFPQVEVREIVQPQVVNTPVKEVAIESKPIMLNPQLVNNLSGSHVASSSIAEIVSKQLELMNQQLLLLNSQGISHLSSPVVNAPNIESKVASEVKTPSTSTQRGVDIKKSKDSFGAQAKIIVEKTANLDAVSLQKIKDFTNKYNQKTKSSKKFAQDNRVNHADPRVVTGFKPESKEVVYPIVIKKSYLQSLWDLDDNQYIDMTCGFGSNFFGNGNERIKKYVLKQIEEGIELGPQHPLVSEVSLLINELTGNERSAFCNTGSEAVLGAMRLARTVTGREKIIVFSGSYHGINDEVIIRGSKSKQSMPAAPGINFSAVSNMIVLDYGTDESLEYIRAHALEVAAVLVEPVQSRRSDFHPKEFLKEVREITLKAKTCLIFDEIITGFRIHPAGAQGYFGIRADLCTYGKIVGGGMPIGVVSGKAEYMDALDGGFWQYGDDSTPTVGVTYFAGTFVRHPLALAAAKGALEILKEGGVAKLTEINDRAQKFADEFNKILKVNQVPIKMDNFGSLMKPKWTSELPSGDLFFAALRLNGVHVYDGFPWFVNMAHTDRDLENVIEAIIKSVGMMQEIGVFPKMNSNAEMNLEINLDVFDAKGPPVVGARIGKDENGLPAWFIDNPDRPGEFLKLKGKK